MISENGRTPPDQQQPRKLSRRELIEDALVTAGYAIVFLSALRGRQFIEAISSPIIQGLKELDSDKIGGKESLIGAPALLGAPKFGESIALHARPSDRSPVVFEVPRAEYNPRSGMKRQMVGVVEDGLKVGWADNRQISWKQVSAPKLPEPYRAIATMEPMHRAVVVRERTSRDVAAARLRSLLSVQDQQGISGIDLNTYQTPERLKNSIAAILLDSGIHPFAVKYVLDNYDWLTVDQSDRGGGQVFSAERLIFTTGLQPEALVHVLGYPLYYGRIRYEYGKTAMSASALSLSAWMITLSESTTDQYPAYTEIITFSKKLLNQQAEQNGRTYMQIAQDILSRHVLGTLDNPDSRNQQGRDVVALAAVFSSLLSWHMGHPFGPRRLPRDLWNSVFAGVCTGAPNYAKKPYYIRELAESD